MEKGKAGRPRTSTDVKLSIVFKPQHLNYFQAVKKELEEETGEPVTKTKVIEHIMEQMPDFKQKAAS